VPRACYEPDAEPFDIVEWIIERLNFQLAAVARSGIYGSNAQRPTEDIENARLQCVHDSQRLVG
jgi:hypothetical protein